MSGKRRGESATTVWLVAFPSRWSCSMAWRAAARAAWWRRALAWVRNAELSARAMAGTVLVECFEGGDDLVRAGLDAAQVLGEPELAVGVGLGDEILVGLGLPPLTDRHRGMRPLERADPDHHHCRDKHLLTDWSPGRLSAIDPQQWCGHGRYGRTGRAAPPAARWRHWPGPLPRPAARPRGRRDS